jgi:hypothetical protein
MRFIPLAQVLKEIDSGRPFDISVVTADVTRGTGGQIKSYAKHVKHIAQRLSKKEAAKAESLSAVSRNPKHFQNSTRNIYDPQKQVVRKIHIRLIVTFNGIKVS